MAGGCGLKQRVVSVLAFLCYYCGVDRLFYWLNRKRKRIITFHNVLPDAVYVDNLANGVSCSESEFKRIVDEIGRRFEFSVDLFDPATVTLTFDDGYLNQYEVAGRVLMDKGIGAILFAAGDLIDSKEPLVVDKLLHWTAYSPTVKDLRKKWITEIRPAYAKDAARGNGIFGQLNGEYPFSAIMESLPDEYVRLRLHGLTSEQIQDLKEHGWIVGWHTRSHFPLSSLTDDEIRAEVTPPPGFADTVFSYPYGEPLSVDERCVRIAEECGYPCAVSNHQGESRLSGRFFLPRMSLPANKHRLHFRLCGAEYFLKNGRLLPR